MMEFQPFLLILSLEDFNFFFLQTNLNGEPFWGFREIKDYLKKKSYNG